MSLGASLWYNLNSVKVQGNVGREVGRETREESSGGP